MSDSDITPFLFEGESLVRVIVRDEEPWFVGADVCRILGYANSPQALAKLDADERGIYSIDTLGGSQEMIIVSEPGLYRLIFGSKKHVAERLKRWLAHDVLPALRKTGSYTMPGAAIIDPGQPPEEALDIDGALKLVNTVCRVWGVRSAQQAYLKLPVLLRVPAMFEPQQQPTLFDMSGQGGAA